MTTATTINAIEQHAHDGTRFADADVTPELVRQAHVWLDDYNGNFSFVVDMLDARARKGGLSIPQVRGVLNCMLAEYRNDVKRAQAQAAAANTNDDGTPAATTDITVRDGVYTVVMDGGNRTIRIRKGRGDAKDVRFVSFLRGADNENDYSCCGLIKDGAFRWTKAFAGQAQDSALATAVNTLINADASAAHEFGKAYAMISGNCYCCNKTLTDAVSIATSVGPVCRKKFGIAAVEPTPQMAATLS